MKRPFHVALTGDLYQGGKLLYPDFDLGPLEAADGIEYAPFAEHRPEIGPDQLVHAQAVIVFSPAVTRRSLTEPEHLLVVSRFGVGYDAVDVPACTEADVVLCIARGAVDRPVAEATLGWMIALSHHMRGKDLLVRTGRWNDRSHLMGSELRHRTLGVIGLGGIGRALVRLLQGFDMKRPLACDPLLDARTASATGVESVQLDELLARADFVSIHCPLSEDTKDLISWRELDLMKPSAYLINTARGGIVDEDALFAALSSHRIAGAALDCFALEPITSPHPFAELDNVLLAPHCIAWTHEMFRDIGSVALQNVFDLAHGRRPLGVVNPEVFEKPSFQVKWNHLKMGE